MRRLIPQTQFDANPYDPSWFDRDFIHSPDGVREWPQHHCKQTFNVSLPFIGERRVAVDIGCRDGEYSRYLQHHFQHLVAFDPRARKLFPFNVDLRKVTHYQCALGDEPGEITMYGGTHDPLSTKRHVVPCFTLDAFELEQVDYIKIDVEGFEKKVLIGAADTIARCRPIIVIEQNDAHLPGEDRYAAKTWLEAHGYRHAATCERGWDHVMVPA